MSGGKTGITRTVKTGCFNITKYKTKKLEIAKVEPSVFNQNKEANRSQIEQASTCSRSSVLGCISSIELTRKLLPREPETIFDF